MSGLAVKLDQVAALRAVRKGQIPDPVTAAAVAELAGADGIIVHLYQDRRHIKDRDVRILRSLVQSKLILEMASTSEMVGVALDIKPDLVTLVPEKREELKESIFTLDEEQLQEETNESQSAVRDGLRSIQLRRIKLKKHFLSNVLIGAVLGISVSLLINLLIF